jgi:hypothetical protein
MDAQGSQFKAVIFSDRGWWVAQCLEVDLCVSAKTRDALPRMLVRQLRGQAALDVSRGKRPFEMLPKAPEKFWRMYSEAQEVSAEELREPWFRRILNAVRGVPGLRAELTLATV